MGSINAPSKALQIRAKLAHPIIDVDGHMREFMPLYMDYLHKTGGAQIVKRYQDLSAPGLSQHRRGGPTYGPPNTQDPRDPERRAWRTPRGAWFGAQMEDTFDAATNYLPGLFYKRMDDIGLDYAILYSNMGLSVAHLPDQELRLATVRALNTYYAEITRELADRLTVTATIPMHTPAEAIAELEHAVGVLGAKTIVIPPGIMRPIPAVHREHPEMFPEVHWVDSFGLDSEHDYDPFWQRCIDMKVGVTLHGGLGSLLLWNGRSLSSYAYNHIGNMALQQHWACKSLFMSGITRRFPKLKLGFMECGVGWACLLYADLISHWDKGNVGVLHRFDPAKLDRARFAELFRQHGAKQLQPLLERAETFGPANFNPLHYAKAVSDPVLTDEWRALKLERREDFKALFTENFHFGCEADDPTTKWAFDTRTNPYRAKLKAMFSTDYGHMDLPDVNRVLEEVYEHVEHELLSPEEFRDFTFTHAASMNLAMNPDFFKGTRVEAAAKKLAAGG